MLARRFRSTARLMLALLALAAPALAGGDPARGVASAVELGIPEPVAVSWSELVVDVPVRVKPVGIRGHVDEIRFADLELNGIPFEVDPYTASFDLPEDEAVALARPLRLRASFARVAPDVFEEAIMPSDTLRLTGTVTVEGTFRKWFVSVKRTVAVPIDVAEPNPIAAYHPLKLALAEMRTWERRGWRLPF